MNPALAATFGPMRPPFLLLVPVVIAVAWGAAIHDGGPAPPGILGLVLLGALAAHISVNALNEYEDFRSGLDQHTQRTPFSGGSGTLPAHPDKAHYALVTAGAALLLVLAIGAWLLLLRGPGLLPPGLLGILLILLYTRWLTRSPLLCLVAPGAGFGPLMVMGSYFALTGTYSPTPAWASLLPLCLVSNLLLMNQFPDREADRAAGRRHLLIARGGRAGVRTFRAILVAGYASVVAGVLCAALPPATLASLLTMPLALSVYRALDQHYDDTARLVPFMARNVVLTLLTPLLLGLGLALGGPVTVST